MMKQGKSFLLSLILLLVLAPPAWSTTVITNFPLTDIGGGIQGSAQASVTNSGSSLDIILTNTSPLHGTPGDYANPFITELEYTIPSGYTLDEANSYVQSISGTYISNGAGVVATALGVQTLSWEIVAADSPGMQGCFMTTEADNQRNDNTIASLNVLDGSLIPQENYAVGFLNPSPNTDSGAVFDQVLLHFVYFGAAPDAALFADAELASLIVKFVGGGDFSAKHVGNGVIIPEPSSIGLIGLGLLLLGVKKRSG